jgi:hypothetical protein
MSRLTSAVFARWSGNAATLFALAFIALPARAQSGDRDGPGRAGRIEFDFADAPVANVEVDLDEDTLSAFTGIGKAAIQGVVESLVESHQGSDDSAVEKSAEHLRAANDIFETASNVIREVRVRVYENLSEQSQSARASMVEHYHKKLEGTDWDRVVRVRDGETSVVVCVSRSGEAIHGVFVMVSEPDDLVMANVVCDLTPEKIKQVTSQATKIGMEVGLENAIEQAIARMDKGVARRGPRR